MESRNSFKTFENTKYQAFNERLHFENAFKNYLISQQKTYPKVMIEGKELDVFILFHLVVQQGGLEEVNRKGWQFVLKSMGIDPNPTNQASVVGYYTACMQTLENSVKSTLQPQFANFQNQSQPQQGMYGNNQGYTAQQFQNANQFAQNQQSFGKSPGTFPNQLQNQAFANQFQNAGMGQYQLSAGMGYSTQNFANQMQGYQNQVYANQGFPQQSYGQVQGQGFNNPNFGQGQNAQANNQQSPRQIPNQLPGQAQGFSQPVQQQAFTNNQQQSQPKYPNQQKQGQPQSQPQQFANQIQQSQQFLSNNQALGFSPQTFQGQNQMRQVPRPQQQQFQSYASQLPSQSYPNLMFNQLSGMQQPYLSQIPVPGQGAAGVGITGIPNMQSGLGNQMPQTSAQMSPTSSVQNLTQMSPTSSVQNLTQMSPTSNQGSTMPGMTSTMQPQTDLQFLNSMFSSIQQGPEKTQSPSPAVNVNSPLTAAQQSASNGAGLKSPASTVQGAGHGATPVSASPVTSINAPASTISTTPLAVTTSTCVAPTLTSPNQIPTKPLPDQEVKMEVVNEESQQIQDQDEQSQAKISDKEDATQKEDSSKQDVDPSKRRVNTVGGLDLQLVIPYLTRPRTIKENYALRSLPYLEICLKSRLPMHVKYALDAMLTLSSELGLKFSEFPSLLTSLVEFMEEVLELKEEEEEDEFISYSRLFEIELTCISSFQANCESSIDDTKLRIDYANVAGLILRNCCLTPENHVLIGSHPGWKKLILECIQLPLPDDFLEMLKGKEMISCTSFNILEQRKNALISLASLGHCVVLPSSEKAFLILEMCIDFMSITNSPYVYPALDALARILVNPSNLGFFTACKNQKRLVEILLELIPTLGFSLSASTQQLSEWELAMMVLGTIVTNCDYQILQQIAKIPKFCRIMFNLVKKPSHFRAGMGQEAFAHLHGMRERGLRCLLAVLKVEGISKRWEQDLLEFSISSHLSGDAWIGPIILQEISLAE